MNIKPRDICIMVFTIVLLSACARGETMPINHLSTTMMPGTPTPIDTTTLPSTPTKPATSTGTDTSTMTPNNTNPPIGYELVDWRGPTEVITPENMNRVERIGRMEFDGQLLRYAWSPDGSKLGVSLYYPSSQQQLTHQNTLIINALTFQEIRRLDGYGYIAFSYDGKILETGGNQYDLDTGEEISHGVGTISYFPGKIMDIEFSPNGEYIAAAGTEYVDLYPMGGNFRHGAFTREGAEPMHTSVSPDSKIIAVDYSFESFTELWDPYKLKPIRILKLVGMGSGGKARFYRNTNTLFLIGWGKYENGYASFIQEWNYTNGQPLSINLLPEIAIGDDLTLDISPISDTIAYLSDYGNIFLIPIHNCQFIKLGKVGGKVSKPGKISFRPDGKLFATQGWGDDAIEFWGIPNSSTNASNESPTNIPTMTSTPCPKIPMVVEQPMPEHNWWGK
jgi:WD40 repeat protein